MGYNVSLAATLTLDQDRIPAFKAASGLPPAADVEAVADYVAEKLYWDLQHVSVKDDGQLCLVLSYGDSWTSEADLHELAGAGMAGRVSIVGEDGNQWVEALRPGIGSEALVVATYCPNDPDPDAGSVLLSRSDAAALMALFTGAQTDQLPAALAKLNAALGN